MDSDRMKNTDSQFISFQDFVPMHNSGPTNQAQINIGASTHPHFNNLSNDTTGIGILEDLQGMPGKTDDSTTPRSFWTIEYYQKYFNVNTNDVVERIKRSMNPQSADNYLVTHIRPNPDLYGPFWICATLVFSIAISGNLASYIEYAHADNYHWRYNFHVVSHAATCIFLYAYLLPFVLWCAIKWSTTQGEQEELIEPSAVPGLLEVICLYGYSLAIYIPVAFLWTIQITLLQWALVIVATCLSGGVLLKSLVPVIVSGKHKLIYTAIILGMHLLLGAGFMLYFFHIPSKNPVTLHPVNMMTVSPPVVSPSINASAKILDAQ